MGFAKRLARKSVRRVTPRPMRGITHPVRKIKHKATPRSIRRLTRASNTAAHPLGALENKAIGTVLGAGSGRRRQNRRRGTGGSSQNGHGLPASSNAGTGQRASSAQRADEAAASQRQLNQLFAPSRQPVQAARPPKLRQPGPVDPGRHAKQEWTRRKGEAHVWQRTERRRLRAEADAYGRACAAELDAQAQANFQQLQAQADAQWQALRAGKPAAVQSALHAAFKDAGRVAILSVGQADAVLRVHLPGLEIVPQLKAYTTPGGRPSAKARTKTEKNQLYASLLAAELVVTARQAYAVCPSLRAVRVIGVRSDVTGNQVLFDVDTDRDAAGATDERYGLTALANARWGLHRSGRAGDIHPWPEAELRPGAAAVPRAAG